MKKHKKQYKMMVDFFNKVANSMGERVKKIKDMNLADKKYWSQLMLAYSQLEGVIKGYTYEIKKRGEYEKKKLDMGDFLILQADGEVPELLRYFGTLNKNFKLGEKGYFKKAFGIDTEDPVKFWGQLMSTSKCSAFIKIIKDKNGKWKDILAGHTTWTEYYEMIRTYKQYILI